MCFLKHLFVLNHHQFKDMQACNKAPRILTALIIRLRKSTLIWWPAVTRMTNSDWFGLRNEANTEHREADSEDSCSAAPVRKTWTRQQAASHVKMLVEMIVTTTVSIKISMYLGLAPKPPLLSEANACDKCIWLISDQCFLNLLFGCGGSGRCTLSSSHRCWCAISSMLIMSCALGSFGWVWVFITDSLSDVYLIMRVNFIIFVLINYTMLLYL